MITSALRDGKIVTESAGSAEPKHPIGSVDNAIRLLLLLRDRPSIRVSEASDELGVAQSTAHRLLAMFEHYGLVQKNVQAKSYSPGPTLLTLGLSVVRHDLRAQLRPIIRSLVELADETCSLLALEGVDTIFLDAVECDRPVRTTSRVGLVRPANCTSGGKALLAELSTEEILRRYPREDIPGVTEFSIRSRSALLVELGRVRENGYAVGNRENEPDIWAIARVVHAPDGTGVCALSLSCPVQRHTPEREAELAALLAGAVAQAEALSR
jgi:DNA-binding IclR family transcriptional regulator